MSRPMDKPVDLSAKLALFEDLWAPKTVARMNDLDLKVVKVHGEFVWHDHDDTDELFLVLDGTLHIEMAGREPVELGPGQLFVVPRGVRHRPIAPEPCSLVLLEPTGVVNTGDEESELTAGEEWI